MSSTEIEQYLAGAPLERAEEEDPEQVRVRIIQQILSAQTPEEVLSAGEAVGARQILDVPLEVEGVSWRRSDYDAGTPWYAVMEVRRLDTGERLAVTCGGQSVMAQLFRLQQLGGLPARVVIRQSNRPTESGYYPLRLSRAT